MHSIAFLIHLRRLAADRLLVIGDGSPIERRAKVAALVAEARGKIHVESLPAYAPDLNPVEGMWRHLKEVELGNVSCLDLDPLHQELHLALGRLREKTSLIPSLSEGDEMAISD